MTRPHQATVQELEDFWQRLQGPLGAALRAAGDIIATQMRERDIAWDDLDDSQIADLFLAAFAEAALHAYPHMDRSEVEGAISIVAQDIKMQLAATADGSDAVN